MTRWIPEAMVKIRDARAEDVLPLEAMRAGRKLESVTRAHAGGGSNLGRGLEHGLTRLRTVAARARHLVLISDGQSVMREAMPMVQAANADGITVSTVAVGLGADRDAMSRLAFEGGGNFYVVDTTLASWSEVTDWLRRDVARRSRRGGR